MSWILFWSATVILDGQAMHVENTLALASAQECAEAAHRVLHFQPADSSELWSDVGTLCAEWRAASNKEVSK